MATILSMINGRHNIYKNAESAFKYFYSISNHSIFRLDTHVP